MKPAKHPELLEKDQQYNPVYNPWHAVLVT